MASSFVIFTIIFSVVILLIIIRLWLNKLEEKTKISSDLVDWLKTSSNQIDNRLNQSMNVFNERLQTVQKTIGEFSEIGRSMQELQEFLRSPKLRGNIGEQVLKELLSQHFPKDSFILQHGFKSGDRVDAIIKTSQGLIPIDSKFPIENFRKMLKAETSLEKEKIRREFVRDVKKHIDDIAHKYILVAEGTVDYALMYIPSESVYYEIINDGELYDFASRKRILPVSPMSFYAYMKAILMSFEGQRIQSQAKEILTVLRAIKKDYEKTDEAFSLLARHLTNAYNQASLVSKNFFSLGQKLDSAHFLPDQPNNSKLID